MPSGAKRFCKAPGCAEFAESGPYCERHASEAESKRAEQKRIYQKSRPSAAKQGYDYKWRKVRSAYLHAHPVCERCDRRGLTELAVMVHHKQPIKDGGDIYDWDNLEALCNPCHEEIEGPHRWARKTPRGGANP